MSLAMPWPKKILFVQFLLVNNAVVYLGWVRQCNGLQPRPGCRLLFSTKTKPQKTAPARPARPAGSSSGACRAFYVIMGPGWRTEDWDSDYLVQNILDLTQIFLASWLANQKPPSTTDTFNTLAEESSACWITSQWTWISPARDIDVVTRVPQFLRCYFRKHHPNKAWRT